MTFQSLISINYIILMSDKPNIPAPNSLVKYASATLVSTSGKPIKDKKKGRDAAP